MKKRIKFLFLIIPLILTLIWFRNGKVVAVGEESFSIFNNRNTISQINFWQENGTGYLTPHYLTRAIPVFFVKTLSSIFPQPWILQALFFFFLLTVGLFSFYLFVSTNFKSKKDLNVIAFSAALFYLFNLYSLSQVWGRFLYAGMSAWALLPLTIYLWGRWLRSGNLKTFFLLILSFVILSNTFLQPANLFTIWIPIVILTIWEIYTSQRKKRILFLATVSFLGFIIANIWWIYPYFILGKFAFSEISDWYNNFESLRGVSQYFSTKEIIFLRQSFLLGNGSPFYEFYSKPWVDKKQKRKKLVLPDSPYADGLVCKQRLKSPFWLLIFQISIFNFSFCRGSKEPV